MKSNKLLVILFVFCYSLIVFGQEIRPEVQKIINNIEVENTLDYEAVGIAGEKTKQYENFESLKKFATTEELLLILKRKNNTSKGYASWALVDTKYPYLKKILSQFIVDKDSVENQNGCISSIDDLATIFYFRVFNQKYYNELSENDNIFFLSQLDELNEIVINKVQSGYLLEKALTCNHKNPKTYLKIKNLALKYKNRSAIEALGEYQKNEDIETIKNLKEDAFPAIAKFPDSSFWSFLTPYSGKISSEDYMDAVVSFKNKEAEELLKNIVNTIPKDSIRNLSKAVIDNYDPLYENIVMSIWENHHIIDHNGTKILINSNPEKAAASFVKVLLNSDKIYLSEFNNDYGSSEKIFPLMLDVIKKHESDKMLKICKHQIVVNDFTRLSFFLNIAKENQLTNTSEEIFSKLEKANSAYDYFHLAETLFSFKNIDKTNKAVLVLKKNKEKWDWGNWSDAFRELFTQNNILWE
ncbi:hypothetical protein SAMN05421664_2436 [Chryseobacterium soldanellicola]|uniref:HEAT repeat-containing protein n=1 Tax=Chryseobacterium soldanellicola TaxID=311333 RepID=A0A1H1DE75_9FLAO|nr:hypothetical protein [Chryseobacterium soldanellicola]SDQ74762.1 hypothetical protein SAMN05421664_2436 [Chryseobacterium soldanellicola]